MKPEEHQKALQEHIKNLNKAIDESIEENQRNIGYNVSQGSVELFALYMHSLHLVEGSGDQWDHRTFKNKRMLEKKVPFEFPNSAKILQLMEGIEKDRSIICYGKRKPQVRIEKMILFFQELRKIVNENITHEKKE